MATPKALLDWGGRPLVAHVAAVVAEAAAPVVVVAAPDQELPPLPAGIEVARDAEPGQGPLAGLAAGMRALTGRADAAFTCGADMPFLTGGAVGHLAVRLSANWDAVVVRSAEGRDQPLGAVYRLSLLGLVDELLAAGERRLGLVAERSRACRVEADAALAAALRGVNTPEELAAARVEAFWAEFVAATGIDGPHTAWGFGNDRAMATELGLLVRDGPKRATAGLRSEYEPDEPLPEPGDLSVILDGDGLPLCVIRTTGVDIRPFADVDEEFAWTEGEGDRSLEYWRRAHIEFFASQGVAVTDADEVVLERFELLWPRRR
jgi:molybdopterin-guanine dinucleotide biosynthesis protein A